MGWNQPGGWNQDNGWYRPAVSGSAYVGPGDINGAAIAWGGLRGFSASYASPGTNPAIDLVDQAQGNALTGVVIKTDGTLDVASISAWVTTHSVTTIFVTKLYDQSGNGRHWTQPTANTQPSLILNAVSTRPAMSFPNTGVGQNILGASSITQAQPFSVSYVAEHVAVAGGGIEAVLGSSASSFASGFTGVANNAGMYAGGSSVGASAADGAFHAIQQLYNGPSSAMYIDGTLTGSLSPGTGNPSSETLRIGGIGGGSFTNSLVGEVGMWAGSTSANNSAMNSNQHTYWGF